MKFQIYMINKKKNNVHNVDMYKIKQWYGGAPLH